jgi:hypothetical protein
MIKTFRGEMEDGDIETIRLSTNNGLTGYRINKLQVIATPGYNMECTLKVFTVPQDAATVDIEFNSPTLLAAATWTSSSSGESYPDEHNVVFDGMIFNQDIYVTAKKQTNMATKLNYYLELERVRLDKSEATVATLKDMRGRE